MATLTIIPYTPKPTNHNIQTPPSKITPRQPSSLNENLRIDSSDVPIIVPPALGGPAGNNWCQKAIRNSDATAQGVQACWVDLVEVRAASISEKGDSDNDTDEKLPSLTPLLPLKYRHMLADEKLSANGIAEKSTDQALDNNGHVFRELTIPGSHDKLITLDGDNKLDNNDSDLHAKLTSYSLSSERQDNDTFNLENQPLLLNHTANEHDDGDIGIDNTKSLQLAKRQRSASPPHNSILCHASTLPPTHNEGRKDPRENINHSDPDESRDGGSWAKRRKVSAPLGGGIAFRNNNGPLHAPSPIAEDDGNDGTASISTDSNLASTTGTNPVYEPILPTEPQLFLQIDADQDWEVRKIIGKEDVDGVLYYMVDWHPTLMPEHSLGHAKELVDEFEARLRAQRKVKKARVGPALKRGGSKS